MSTEEIDEAVLRQCRAQWRKVARVIVSTGESLAMTSDQELDLIAERLAHLVAVGRLEAQGNLANWRFSEVRLP